ncbi:ZrgA family zinc uptake protein [Arenicellales bacterium IMCC57338]
MIKRNLILILILVTCSLGASAAAQSTHVHGQGQVGMAIDQNLISMTLESPGADIVGFEHEARTAEEKTAVTEALKQLSDPMFVIQLPANASCKVVQASSEVTSENGDEGHADHEEHEEHADHNEHESEAHGSFIAEYQLECANVAVIDFITFVYFGHFRNAQSLMVVLIDKNGQHRHKINRDIPILYLKK